MYYSHFGLSGPPFQLTSSPTSLFMGKRHREAFAALEWGLLREPSGFTVLVGEVGTGKTTLVMAILARQQRNVWAVYLNNPKLSFDELLKVIMKQLRIKAQRKSRLGELEAFNEFLCQLESGERIVIIIDEAQDLSDDTMEQLRLLSNNGKVDEKQLHFVFVGQPELLRRLASPSLRQLDQRIGARSVLNPLQQAEARQYIEHRLKATGGSAKKIFGWGALRHLIRQSGGVPRRMNVLCHNAMLLAYSAGAKRVDMQMVRAAVAEYHGLVSRLPQSGHAGTGGSIRRWASRLVESAGLRLLELSRRLGPREPHAIEADSVVSPAMQQVDVAAEKPGVAHAN